MPSVINHNNISKSMMKPCYHKYIYCWMWLTLHLVNLHFTLFFYQRVRFSLVLSLCGKLLPDAPFSIFVALTVFCVGSPWLHDFCHHICKTPQIKAVLWLLLVALLVLLSKLLAEGRWFVVSFSCCLHAGAIFIVLVKVSLNSVNSFFCMGSWRSLHTNQSCNACSKYSLKSHVVARHLKAVMYLAMDLFAPCCRLWKWNRSVIMIGSGSKCFFSTLPLFQQKTYHMA